MNAKKLLFACGMGRKYGKYKLYGYTKKYNQLLNTDQTSIVLENGKKYLTKVNGTYSLVNGTGQTLTDLVGGTDMVINLTQDQNETLTLQQALAYYGTSYLAYTGEKGALMKADLKGAEFRGKNYINVNDLLNLVNWKRYAGFTYNQFEINGLKPNTQYTISFSQNGYRGVSGNNVFMSLNDTISNWMESSSLIHNSGETGYCPTQLTQTSNSEGKLYIALYSPNQQLLRDIFITNCPNVMLEEGNQATTYAPYVSPIISQVDVQLGGNDSWADEWFNWTGLTNRKSGEVDLESLNFSYDGVVGRFYTRSLSDFKRNGSYNIPNENAVCSKLTVVSLYQVNSEDTQEAIYLSYSEDNLIKARSGTYTDATTFKQAISGVKLSYELATPTTQNNPSLYLPLGITKCTDKYGHEIEIVAVE